MILIRLLVETLLDVNGRILDGVILLDLVEAEGLLVLGVVEVQEWSVGSMMETRPRVLIVQQ